MLKRLLAALAVLFIAVPALAQDVTIDSPGNGLQQRRGIPDAAAHRADVVQRP